MRSQNILIVWMIIAAFFIIAALDSIDKLEEQVTQLTNRIVQLEKSHSYGPQLTR